MSLRKIGYTYLACETFYPAVSAQPRYATAAHGYYVREPVSYTHLTLPTILLV